MALTWQQTVMIKSYLEVIKDVNRFPAMHYFSVEITHEKFIEQIEEIEQDNWLDFEMKSYRDENLNLVSSPEDDEKYLDEEFPFLAMTRTENKTQPVQLQLFPDLNIMKYFDCKFAYPEGTTHFYTELYHEKDFHNQYMAEKNTPIALRIEGDINSTDSSWYVYKEVQDLLGEWTLLPKGTRCTEKCHSIEELTKFVRIELAEKKFIVDSIVQKLPEGSSEKILFDMYSYNLSDFFQNKFHYERIVKYFELRRVFPIGQNHFASLNDLFFNMVRSEVFQKVYSEVLNEF